MEISFSKKHCDEWVNIRYKKGERQITNGIPGEFR